MACGGSFRAQHALSRRSHGNPRTHRRRREFARVYSNRRLRHRLRAHERVLRNHHHCALHIPVRIRNVGDVCGVVNDRRVIDVGHLRNVHRGIADVDAVHVCLADVIRRHINFPRTKRKPSYISSPASRTSADEDHERWGVHCLYRHWSGYPTPASTDRNPATVVKRRIAPWGVIDPRVAPGIDPIPMASVIRSPSGFHLGIPDVPVIRIIAPVAMVIEIVIADHIVRKVLRGTRRIVTVIAILGPGIEVIEGVNRLDIGGKRIGPAECASLPGAQVVGLAIAGGLAFAHADAHHCVAAVRTRLHAIAARLHDRERLVRRIDLEGVVLVEPAYRNIDRAGSQLDLNRIVIQVQERDAAVLR